MEEIKQKKKKGRGDRSGVGATDFKHLGKLLYLVSPNSENGATQYIVLEN